MHWWSKRYENTLKKKLTNDLKKWKNIIFQIIKFTPHSVIINMYIITLFILKYVYEF